MAYWYSNVALDQHPEALVTFVKQEQIGLASMEVTAVSQWMKMAKSWMVINHVHPAVICKGKELSKDPIVSTVIVASSIKQ